MPPDDTRSLAEALTKLVVTPRDELDAMGRRGAEFVLENYSTSKLVDRTIEVYRAVMGRDLPQTGGECSRGSTNGIGHGR